MNPLLRTKLHVPTHRPNEWIARPRLTERLDESLRRKLTLISAPAGFGKTTLVTDWIHRRNLAVAWLSLDERENEPLLFLRYLLAALQTVEPDLGQELHRAFQASPPPPLEMILTGLINELAPRTEPLILVLDDYHAIDNPAIDRALSFLLEHLPPALHLILASRIDPNLSLARLRVRGDLVEIRADALRFTHQEAADFLAQMAGFQLPPDAIAALEERTEGWIAGLQLAALSLHNSDDVAGFIDSFTGSHRYVMDYLTDEVLERQPEEIRRFLLQTSILERLCGELCDAVLEISDWRLEIGRQDAESLISNLQSQPVLEDLERRNLFLIPLDNQKRWFRYHHLFADLLRRRLHQTTDVDVAALHRRAGRWFERQRYVDEAVHHALAAGETSWAADLIEAQVSEALRYGQVQWAADHLDALPDETVARRPELLMARAWVHYFMQQPDQIHRPLDRVETLANSSDLPDERRDQLIGQTCLLRAWAVRSQGDRERGVDLLRRALDLLPETDANYRGLAYLFLGSVLDTQGHLDEAMQTLEKGAEVSLQADNLAAYIGAHSSLASAERRLGRLRQARERLERVLRWAEQEGVHYLSAMADLHIALAEIRYEQNDLAGMEQHLARARTNSERGLATTRIPAMIDREEARLHLARGDVEAARRALQRASAHIDHWPVSAERRNAFVDRAQIYLRLGDLDAAERWRREAGVTLDKPVDAFTPETWGVAVRIMLARHRRQGAPLPVDALLELLSALQTRHAGLKRHLAEFAMLAALVHAAQGDEDTALAQLARALDLAAPQGYVRVFLDEGEPLRRLLVQLLADGSYQVVHDDAAQLLAAFPREDTAEPAVVAIRPAPDTAPAGLLEPLTEREAETLRLLATELSIPEIAGELVVAVSTVRSYCKRIYSKLDVHSRIEAVARAKQLGLI